jgi:hypothetical protein
VGREDARDYVSNFKSPECGSIEIVDLHDRSYKAAPKQSSHLSGLGETTKEMPSEPYEPYVPKQCQSRGARTPEPNESL